MALDQCWAVAGKWYPGRMDAAWRGLPGDAAQAIFEAAGLKGSFWRMT